VQINTVNFFRDRLGLKTVEGQNTILLGMRNTDMKLWFATLASCASLAILPTAPAMATTVFTENFNGETPGLS
jgi:hypothetical protein